MFLTKKNFFDSFDLFENYFDDDFFKSSGIKRNYKLTTENGTTKLIMEVPGYGKEDLEISIENSILTIKSLDNKINNSVMLPYKTDLDSLDAKCEKGILTITSKSNEKKEKKLISIK